MFPSIHDLIAERAYHLYLERQREGRGGDQLTDWLAAENEMVVLDLTPGGSSRFDALTPPPPAADLGRRPADRPTPSVKRGKAARPAVARARKRQSTHVRRRPAETPSFE